MSAIIERERRATAGKRMTSLVGKAAEEDAQFWGHDTWQEDDSGNDSFHESDEDSELQRDEFDSDFNDSESDREQEEQAAGDEEERLIAREERKQRSKKSAFDVSRAGRELLQKRKGKVKKRIVGHGVNAGIVLNVPGGSLPPFPQQPLQVAPSPTKRKNDTNNSSLTVASTRPRRTSQLSKYSSRFRAARSDATKDDASTRRKSAAASKTKKRRKRFSQEELLLEAANETEPENERWLLARKRVQDQNEKDKETPGREIRGSIIEQWTSRRGTLNTVQFPEMDHVPTILTQPKRAPTPPSPIVCVITGKRARYRDPRTMMGYCDAAAFKELRRRHEAGEPLDQRKIKAKQTKAAANRKAPPPTSGKITSTNGHTNEKPKVARPADPNVQKSQKTRLKSTTSAAPVSQPASDGTKDSKAPAMTSTSKAPVTSENDIASAAITPQFTRRDSAMSNESSQSRRSSPRRRKPSAKLLQSIELGSTVASIPSSIVAAAVPANSSHDTPTTVLYESEKATPTESTEVNHSEQTKPSNGDATTTKLVNPP